MGHHPATWYDPLIKLLPESLHGAINPWVLVSWTVILFLTIAMIVGTRHMQKVPRGWQNLWEWTYEVFRNFAVGVMGPVGEKYMPFLACCFIYIFCLNVSGIIPGLVSPTTNYSMTAALALTVFFYVQFNGLRAHGMGYLKHFLGEPFEPMVLFWILAPLNVIIHTIGELAKPLSLSVRLFGNIFGEETVVNQLLNMGAGIGKATYHMFHVPIPVPIHLVMVAFAIFGGFIQALIFTMLTAVYISMAVGAGHEEHAGAEAHEHGADARASSEHADVRAASSREAQQA